MNKKKRSLERLDNEKFKLSQDKLGLISGGKMDTEGTYEYYCCELADGGSVSDPKLTDMRW